MKSSNKESYSDWKILARDIGIIIFFALSILSGFRA